MRRIHSYTLDVALAIAADSPTAIHYNRRTHEHGYATAPYWRGRRSDGITVVDGGACPGANALAVVWPGERQWIVVTSGGHVQACCDGMTYITPRRDIEKSQTQWSGVSPEEGCVDSRFVSVVEVLVPKDLQVEFWRRVAGYSGY
jgi:hypothetical protein